jgi:hypothetical protein
MINIKNNFLQFCYNQVICQLEESFTTNKLFYYLVSKSEKFKKKDITQKTKTLFFSGYIGYTGYTPKNNDLTPVFVTGLLPCNRNRLFLHCRHSQRRHQTPNARLYFTYKIPP